MKKWDETPPVSGQVRRRMGNTTLKVLPLVSAEALFHRKSENQNHASILSYQRIKEASSLVCWRSAPAGVAFLLFARNWFIHWKESSFEEEDDSCQNLLGTPVMVSGRKYSKHTMNSLSPSEQSFLAFL